MLYTLNLHSAICQLYLNKTGRKKKQKPKTVAASGEEAQGIRMGGSKCLAHRRSFIFVDNFSPSQ